MAKFIDGSLLDIGGFPGTLTISGEIIDVTPPSEPDTDWKFTDAAGHIHRYWGPAQNRYRSLTTVTETIWCPDCREDEDVEHYECIECGETIVPGTRQPKHHQYVRGPISGHANVTIPPGIEPPEEIEFEHEGRVISLKLISMDYEAGLPANAEFAVMGIRDKEDDMVRIVERGLEPDEKEDGLYAKYRVFREPHEASEHPVPVDAVFYSPGGQRFDLEEVTSFIFPLKPDTDPHARVALAAYAWSVRDEKPFLWEDLMRVLDDLPQEF